MFQSPLFAHPLNPQSQDRRLLFFSQVFFSTSRTHAHSSYPTHALCRDRAPVLRDAPALGRPLAFSTSGRLRPSDLPEGWASHEVFARPKRGCASGPLGFPARPPGPRGPSAPRLARTLAHAPTPAARPLTRALPPPRARAGPGPGGSEGRRRGRRAGARGDGRRRRGRARPRRAISRAAAADETRRVSSTLAGEGLALDKFSSLTRHKR